MGLALKLEGRFSDWMKKQDPDVSCLQEIFTNFKDTNRLKVKEWGRVYYVNTKNEKAGMSLLTSDKVDFKTKSTIRNKKGHLYD